MPLMLIVSLGGVPLIRTRCRSGRGLSVGRSFTAVTVRTNVSVLVANPSLTLRVMVAVTYLLVAGMRVTARFVENPSKKMLALGTRAVFDELAVRVRPTGPASGSFTVNGTVMALSSG